MANLDIRKLKRSVKTFREDLAGLKAQHAPAEGKTWFAYDILGNIEVFNGLLNGKHRDLGALIGDRPIADIGAADGDVAFFLASHGVQAHVVDHAPVNWNGLDGARKLKELLDSPVEIHDVDLDSYFDLPHDGVYGLTLFLGILYHLKNPYYALEKLAERSDYCLFSTKVARLTPDHSVDYHDLPLAYLLDPAECNNDVTNYWVFSDKSLRRILDRTGWDVLEWRNLGDTKTSDPADVAHDERAYALLKSRVSGR